MGTSSRSLALLVASAALVAPLEADSFEIHRHSFMSLRVLQQAGAAGAVSSSLMLGAAWPDLVGCVLQAYCDPPFNLDRPAPSQDRILLDLSPNHFDNNQLDASIERVHERMREAGQLWRSLENAANPWDEDQARTMHRAMFAFGQALHAIQDFYAHSTYLECNVPLARIGCSRNLPIWNGLPVGGCNAAYTVDGVTDLQTGYFKISPPPGSTTHDALNKDHAGTSQGLRIVTRLFPPASCYTYYGVLSGQYGAAGATDAFEATGLAMRHSAHALAALDSGGPVFGSLPVGTAAATREVEPNAAGESLFDLIARANSDPAMIALSQEIETLVDFDNPDPNAFPLGSLDGDGLPVPEPSTVSMLVQGVLFGGWLATRRSAQSTRR